MGGEESKLEDLQARLGITQKDTEQLQRVIQLRGYVHRLRERVAFVGLSPYGKGPDIVSYEPRWPPGCYVARSYGLKVR